MCSRAAAQRAAEGRKRRLLERHNEIRVPTSAGKEASLIWRTSLSSVPFRAFCKSVCTPQPHMPVIARTTCSCKPQGHLQGENPKNEQLSVMQESQSFKLPNELHACCKLPKSQDFERSLVLTPSASKSTHFRDDTHTEQSV